MPKALRAAILTAMLATGTALAQQSSPTLEIQNLQATSELNGLGAVSGVAVNRSSSPIKNAFITFNLYNAQGMLVGNTIATASNLAPGEQWAFRAAAPYTFATVKVAEIKAYER